MRSPNFMCIGAAKSGTTTLYDILRQHPQVYIPTFKEPHFFDIPENFNNGKDWYLKSYFQNAKNEKWLGDFTPSYFFGHDVAQRIHSTLGSEVKFIVILRHPVDRAYSHYLHAIRDEREELSFEEAIEQEQQRLASYIKEKDYVNVLRHSYLSQSMYGKMLETYLNFFPLEQFLIINFEDEFLSNRQVTIDKVYDFLGLDKAHQFDIHIKSNPASKAKSKRLKRWMQKKGWWRKLLKKSLPAQFRQILKNKIQRANISSFSPEPLDKEWRKIIFDKYFAEDVAQLEKIIGKNQLWS